MRDARAALPDPGERLTAVFRAAAARMRGLAFINPALGVEAVAFAPWQAHWLGVMVTPWCMNLLLTPREPAAWQPLAPGAKRRYRFPAGDYDFVGARDDDFGDYQVCSLFSPLLEFDDHATAREVAMLARAALFDAANADAAELAAASLPSARAQDERPGPLARVQETLKAPLSRKELLHGRIPADDRDHRR